MANNVEVKIKTTVMFTPRQTTYIRSEARRLEITDAEVVRRIVDDRMERMPAPTKDPRAGKLYDQRGS